MWIDASTDMKAGLIHKPYLLYENILKQCLYASYHFDYGHNSLLLIAGK